jgi:hypothetical protein
MAAQARLTRDQIEDLIRRKLGKWEKCNHKAVLTAKSAMMKQPDAQGKVLCNFEEYILNGGEKTFAVRCSSQSCRARLSQHRKKWARNLQDYITHRKMVSKKKSSRLILRSKWSDMKHWGLTGPGITVSCSIITSFYFFKLSKKWNAKRLMKSAGKFYSGGKMLHRSRFWVDWLRWFESLITNYLFC